MGVRFDRILELFEAGYIRGPKPRILDVGCSNVHTIDADRLVDFVLQRNPAHDPVKLRAWANLLSSSGLIDSELGGTNGAWLGDVLSRAGCEYTAFDIFPGYRTELVDLNEAPLADHHRGQYDVVLNFGTTEHVLGQYNAFRVIHDAAAVGGLILHELPMTGHLDHGFVNYNPVTLVSLAEANGYEILSLSFSAGMAGETIARLAQRYEGRDYFSAPVDAETLLTTIPTASVRLIARKLQDRPFRASLETSTTVGEVSGFIDQRYGVSKDEPETAERDKDAILGRVRDLLFRARDASLSLSVMNEVYDAFLAAGLTKGFPFTLELRMLNEAIEVHPDSPHLVTRRDLVVSLLRRERPLLKAVDALPATASQSLMVDGIEAGFDPQGEPEAVFAAIIDAYRIYFERAAVELFPLRLEALALDHMAREWPRDADVLVRLGKVVAEVSPNLETAI